MKSRPADKDMRPAGPRMAKGFDALPTRGGYSACRAEYCTVRLRDIAVLGRTQLLPLMALVSHGTEVAVQVLEYDEAI